nr:hypothetical protein [Tanacetum cinerariifolium]
MVSKDDETSKDKEIDKLIALISLSFKKIYKPTNNNLRTSSNTSHANQDNSPRINRSAGYENQRIGNVVGARETVGSSVVQRSGIQCYNCKEFEHVARECQKPKRAKDADYHREKMLLCKQEKAGIQLNAEQADWRDNTDDDELEDQELEAHYIVHPEQSESVHDTYPIEQDAQNVIIDSLDMHNDREEIDQNDDDNDLAKEREIKDFKNKNKSLESSNNFFKEANNTLSETNDLLYADYKKSQAELTRRASKEYASQMELECAKCLNEEMVADLRYFNSLELEVDSLTSQLETQRTQSVNEIDRLSREYYYADHMNAILGVYTELDEDLKAQLQDKDIVISELKKLLEKLKGKSVDTKFEKSSVIRQPNAFKNQRPSVLGKPTTFSNSFVRKDFSKSTSITQTHVSNDFSKPVTAQTLPTNKKSILKNTNVLAPGMYKLHTDHTQTRTSQLHQDSMKPNKRMSFSTGVIPRTSVSRPQLKSNPQEDRVMHNNSHGKKQEVEDQRRSVKLSKNKTSVNACNDSLNAKTLNVKSVSAMCNKCVLIDKYAMCVLKSVAKPSKEIVASESNKKPRNFTRKLYERFSKTCSWWYPKFTPSGYKWKPKSGKENVNPNVSMPLGNTSRTANVMDTMTSRRSIM